MLKINLLVYDYIANLISLITFIHHLKKTNSILIKKENEKKIKLRFYCKNKK